MVTGLDRTQVTAVKADTGKLNWTWIALLGLGDIIFWGLGIASTFWFFGRDTGVAGIAFSTVSLPYGPSFCFFAMPQMSEQHSLPRS